MNGIPEPYPNKTHVVVRGRIVVVTDHAPNSDGWRYHGVPADLTGDSVSFSHDEALPVRDATPSAVYAQEIAELQIENVEPTLAPLEELLSVVEHIARRGHAELRQALNIYRDATSLP